jgi:hypothetical protein
MWGEDHDAVHGDDPELRAAAEVAAFNLRTRDIVDARRSPTGDLIRGRVAVADVAREATQEDGPGLQPKAVQFAPCDESQTSIAAGGEEFNPMKPIPTIPCTKCEGIGRLPHAQHEGRCYACNLSGWVVPAPGEVAPPTPQLNLGRVGVAYHYPTPGLVVAQVVVRAAGRHGLPLDAMSCGTTQDGARAALLEDLARRGITADLIDAPAAAA